MAERRINCRSEVGAVSYVIMSVFVSELRSLMIQSMWKEQ